MIKLIEFVARNSAITAAEFHAAWRAAYAVLFAATPAARSLVVRCELNHRLAEDYVRSRHATEFSGADWDGVAVFWFASLAEFNALQRLPEFIEFRARECATYRRAESAAVLTDAATVIVDRPAGRARAELKLLCILRRNAALDRATFYRHWREHHGGLFQTIAELNDPVLAYDQNHGIANAGASVYGEQYRGEDYDGVTEQWFESLPAWIDSLNAPANYDRVAPDVAYMLDPSSIQFILAGRPSVIVADD